MRNRTTAMLITSTCASLLLLLLILRLPTNPPGEIPPALRTHIPSLSTSSSVVLHHTQMLKLQNQNGTALVQLFDQPTNSILYRWRYRGTGRSQEQSGIASVPRHSDTATNTANTPQDDNTAVIAIAEAFALRCAYNEQASTWTVYFDPATTTAFVQNDGRFEDIPL